MFHSCNWGRWIESQIKLCIYLHKFPIPTHTEREKRERNIFRQKNTFFFSNVYDSFFAVRADRIFLPIFVLAITSTFIRLSSMKEREDWIAIEMSLSKVNIRFLSNRYLDTHTHHTLSRKSQIEICNGLFVWFGGGSIRIFGQALRRV